MTLLQDQPSRRLRTWKEIAAYFGRDERTVKRWEARRGLPVHRAPGGGGATVFALVDELEAWMRGAPAAELGETETETETRTAADAAQPAVPAPGAPGAEREEATAARLAESSARRRWARPVLAASLVALLVAGAVGAGFGMRRRAGAPSVARQAAQAFYSRGLYAWNTRTAAGLAEAQDDFTQAVVHDPSFAQAYAGLADVYNLSPEFATLPPEQAFPRARAAAEQAVALDGGLAAAHRSLAFADFWWFRRIPQAEAQFRRALELDPGSAQTHHWFSNMLNAQGRYAEGLRESDAALALDPQSTAARADRSLLLLNAGRFDEAIQQLREIAVARPDFCPTHVYLIKAYMDRGDLHNAALAWAALRRAKASPSVAALAADAEAAMARGDLSGLAAAQYVTARRLHVQGQISSSVLARYAMRAGDRAGALRALRDAVQRPDVDVVAYGSEPTFSPLRGDPAFQKILAAARTPVGG